jgi:hypothetical protein
MALLLAFCIMPTAFAEEYTDNATSGTNITAANISGDSSAALTVDDEREARDISYPYGAKVRLLELEKKITRNLLIGTKVVGVIGESNSAADLAKLQAILDEMEALLKEVKNTNLDGNKTALAKQYIGLKKEAILLSKQFRDEARPYINQTIKKDLAVTTNLIDTAALRNLSEEIKDAKCEFNAGRLETIFGSLNAGSPHLINRVRECNATKDDIAKGISQAFRNLSAEEKKSINDKARENAIKANIEKKEFISQIRANFTARNLERQKQVLEKIRNLSLEMNKTRFAESVNDRIARISAMEGRNGEKHGLRPIGNAIMPGGTRR